MVGFKLLFEIFSIEMFISSLLGLAKSHTVDDGSMVQCVTNDEIFRSINGFEESGIGIESTWEQDGVFSVVIIGDNFLQLFVDVLGTADESN